jgi:AraC family transcriptional regulator, exoenzyme S synthesis regulatory protein ExsA
MNRQFPRDLVSSYRNVKVKTSEMYGVYFEAGDLSHEDILQTSHALEITLYGSATVRAGDKNYRVNQDDIQFRKRGNYQISFSEDYQSLIYCIENDFIHEFLKLHIFSYPSAKNLYLSDRDFTDTIPPYVFRSTPLVMGSIDQGISSVTNAGLYASCQVKLSAHMILLQMLSMDNSNLFVKFLKFLVTDQKAELGWFMENNFRQQLSLAELAKLSGRSESSFKKEFKEFFNTSPFRWILRRRLEYARFLLESSGLNISEIAAESGFENLSHFSRSYKEVFGKTPSEEKGA